ncbi:MAG: ATPase [delta proteobacterium ML8_D]|nr:MAG: ATPase [delta proteobacterium ML8_D]
MLTRLKVSGFKNLVDVDVRFGPFTCVTGPNGAGKSNLFDAIRFLSALADETLVNAALSVCAGGKRPSDISSLFYRIGDRSAQEMSFEAEMIIPGEGIDDLGQKAKASITFLRYTLFLAYRAAKGLPSMESIELIREDLDYIKLGEAWRHLRFPHKAGTWRKSAVQGKRTSPLISTGFEGKNRIIKLIQEGGGRKTNAVLASALPRTVLSTVNTIENPAALLARREMQSWQMLQLQPSSIHTSDRFPAPRGRLGADGFHLAAALYCLAYSDKYTGCTTDNEAAVRFYDKIAARLAELMNVVYGIRIDRDEHRSLLTLELIDRNGTVYPAHSLSYGTLRFLALAVLEANPKAGRLICLEEPENGIYPERIPALLQLLQGMVTDVKRRIGPDNPLRQIIVTTYSPAIVNMVPDDSLLFAESAETFKDGRKMKGVCFRWLPDTWRQRAAPEVNTVIKDSLPGHFVPPVSEYQDSKRQPIKSRHKRAEEITSHPDLQLPLPCFSDLG